MYELGNTRQLEHTIEGALNLINDEKIITFDHLPYTFQQQMLEEVNNLPTSLRSKKRFMTNGTLTEQLEQLEMNLIQNALQEADGNITKASELLGISRQNLNYKLKKFHITTK